MNSVKYIPPSGLANLNRKDQKYNKNKYNINLYNTCYINASIQCFLRLDGFITKIFGYQNGNLVKATKNLIKDMQNKYKYLSVSEIKVAMSELDEKYNNNNPEDANEFITDYLNELLEETRITDNLTFDIKKNNFYDENFSHFLERFYKNGYSFISELFFGFLKTENKCKKCGYRDSIKYHVFNILDLPLQNSINKNDNNSLEIGDIITKFTSEKEIFNIKCKFCNASIYSKTDFYKLPDILILYFERNGAKYITNDINILETINFNYFLQNNGEKSLYKIKGIIYYSFLKNNMKHYSSACHFNNMWYYFDDNSYEISANMFQYKNDFPIILFYEKIN